MTEQQTQTKNTDSDSELSLEERVAIYIERLDIEGNAASTKDLFSVFKNDTAVHAWLDMFDIPRMASN